MQFLHISLGSLAEFETLTILSNDLGYIDNSDEQKHISKQIDEIEKMIHSMLKTLKLKVKKN